MKTKGKKQFVQVINVLKVQVYNSDTSVHV